MRRARSLLSKLHTRYREEVLKGMRRYYRYRGPRGRDVTTADWDDLVIADACRGDLLSEVRTEETVPAASGDTCRSLGATTPEFLERTFEDAQLYDTVYVTANPIYRVSEWCSADLSDTFHAIVDVWASEWDSDLGTVRPEAVTEAAYDARDRFPQKRLLVHYVQPHYPFVGSAGNRIEHRGMQSYQKATDGETTGRWETTIWGRLKNGEVSRAAVWEAYRENLELVLPHVAELLDTFEGRTVFTSDHGNHVGGVAFPFPIRMYGHMDGIYTSALTRVPWIVQESGTRREIVSEPPSEQSTGEQPADEESAHPAAEQRLRGLGYR